MQKNSPKPTIGDVKIMEPRGPWATKSGGTLEVLMALPFDTLEKSYLTYPEEMPRNPDIRGIRLYTIRNILPDQRGGMEWHKIREEIIFSLEGSMTWMCEDTFGETQEYVLSEGQGIWIPPFILHTYKSLKEKSALLVFANTLFIPESPETHDTYSLESFREIQCARS